MVGFKPGDVVEKRYHNCVTQQDVWKVGTLIRRAVIPEHNSLCRLWWVMIDEHEESVFEDHLRHVPPMEHLLYLIK